MLRLRMLWRVAPILAWLAVLGSARSASADEPVSALLAAPTTYTDVADAFEPGNPIDVNVRLGFQHDVTSATIKREVVDSASQDGRSSQHERSVADYTRVQNQLSLRLEAGVYHDLMLFMQVPIVLGDEAELSGAAGRAAAGTLFDVSKTLSLAKRSGVPSVDFGVAWGVINQYRMPHLATWVLILQGSVDTGSRMRPCLDGQRCEAGVSRGTSRIRLESRWSYRYRYLEPYFGVHYTYEWASSASDQFRPPGISGVVDGAVPSVAGMVLGTSVIPWEDRARWQRFEVELRGSASFTSAGRDYSPLFDVLGSSKDEALAQPNMLAGRSDSVRFNGITSVQAHARLGLDTQVVMRAARYMRFALGGGLAYVTSHLITGAPACDATVKPSAGDERAVGCEDGIVNPVYRQAIDAPGNRFRVAGQVALQLQLSATAQF